MFAVMITNNSGMIISKNLYHDL